MEILREAFFFKDRPPGRTDEQLGQGPASGAASGADQRPLQRRPGRRIDATPVKGKQPGTRLPTPEPDELPGAHAPRPEPGDVDGFEGISTSGATVQDRCRIDAQHFTGSGASGGAGLTGNGASPAGDETQDADKHTGKPAELALGRPFRQQGIEGRKHQQADQRGSDDPLQRSGIS